jgi:hypothetical protein
MTSPEPAKEGFLALRNADLSEMSGAEWDFYYSALAPWLSHDDPEIRKQALERLSMAVLWAESSSHRRSRREDSVRTDIASARLDWMIQLIDLAHNAHNDVIPTFLDELRFKGHDEPFRSGLIPWLERLQKSPPTGVEPGVAEGTLVLMRHFEDEDPDAMAAFIALLDAPHAYVRACAARRIGTFVDSENAASIFALIGEKELSRPGVAGPFWSEWHGMRDAAPIDVVEWMMDLLERRHGSPPTDLPFNDIDFYLHELCDHSPATVQRMIDGNHLHLAVMTATETNGVVEGMEPILRKLGNNPDQSVSGPARFHLASYYRFLHPGATDGSIQHRPDWSPDADLFSFHWGKERHLWFVVIYPKLKDATFDDAQAWKLVDLLLPPDLRGHLVRHELDWPNSNPPKPFRLGNTVSSRFSSGANLTLTGHPESQSWTRIEIGGGQLRDRWKPFAA